MRYSYSDCRRKEEHMRIVVVAFIALATVTARRPSRRKRFRERRTAGPDLQGTWDFAQLTPLERPSEFASKALGHRRGSRGVRAARASRPATKIAATAGRRPTSSAPTTISGGTSARASRSSRRSSSIRRTAGFRTLTGQRASATRAPAVNSTTTRRNGRSPNAASSASTQVRRWCRARTTTTCSSCRRRDHVVILNEMIHSARIVDLSGRPHHAAVDAVSDR